MSMKNNKLRNGILIGAVVLLALIAGTSAVTIVPAGHTGVIVTMGKVSDRVLSEGMHMKVPFAQQIVMMNNKIQKTEIDSNGVSKDLQTVSSGVAINYHINKDDSAKIYQSIGEGYADTVLQPAIQESMKAITAQYTAEELITKRSAVGEEIGATLAEKVQEYGILIDKFNIINFDFSEEFNAAIEQKQVAEQNKLRAETEKEPKAELAAKGEGDFCAGEHCRFCKVKATCRKRAEYNLQLAKYDFAMPDKLTDTEIETILETADQLTAWVADVKEYALRQALSGKQWHGYKVVAGKSNRKYTNPAAVAAAVQAYGKNPYKEPELLGVTAMEQLLGRTQFEALLGSLTEKPQGKPTLVPYSDKRPAWSNAQEDFNE